MSLGFLVDSPSPASDPFPEELLDALAAVRARAGSFGTRVYYYRVVGSTNDVASTLAASGAADGTLVIGDMQTRGRGRLGRDWFSPAGAGLYFSLVVRPDSSVAAAAPPVLTLVAGVAAAEGIERATGLVAAIKWPNDLVIDERPSPSGRARRRKLAGILAEGTIVGGAIQHVVLGIGINLRDGAYPADLRDRVTSIEREIGRDVSRDAVLGECLASLWHWWRVAADGGIDAVLDAWRHRSPSASGASVRITTPHGPEQGRTDGIDADGALRVLVGGRRQRVVAGEVEWL